MKKKPSKNVSYDTKAERPTETAYAYLQKAYDYFNQELWAGKLPQCLITLQRHRGAYGYFCGERFARVEGTAMVDEIAMNPQHFAMRPAMETISTLVHEMAHLWQKHFGKEPRRCYHDKQWATEMKRIGLHPSSTAAPGGKETGQRVSHYIVTAGAFELAWERWVESEKPGLYADVAVAVEKEKAAKAKQKVKYTCPECELNAWGKRKLHIVCGECQKRMEPEAEDEEENEEGEGESSED